MDIKYYHDETEYQFLITECPFEVKSIFGTVIKVGSILCTECTCFIDRDMDKRIVKCGYCKK